MIEISRLGEARKDILNGVRGVSSDFGKKLGGLGVRKEIFWLLWREG